MPTRSKYWSCTAFADWIRGSKKGRAKTSGDWSRWRKQAKDQHPIRYWIAEEGLDAVQNFLWYPVDQLYKLKYYINNRWVTRTHALTAHARDIPRGEWRDVGDRFLPCLFNELVDFVEIELAWSNIAWDSEARAKFNAPFYSWGWFRWRTWRSPDSGLAYLDWSMTLTNEEFLRPDEKHLAQPTTQAISAREIKELYLWWKEVYPNRPDVHDASGWSAYCDMRRQKGYDLTDFDNETEDEERICKEALDKIQQIEKQYHQEDEEMLVRLIKVRHSLWS